MDSLSVELELSLDTSDVFGAVRTVLGRDFGVDVDQKWLKWVLAVQKDSMTYGEISQYIMAVVNAMMEHSTRYYSLRGTYPWPDLVAISDYQRILVALLNEFDM